MFILYARKNSLAVRKREPVTSGSVNVYSVKFEFSADWDDLVKTAVFRAGTVSRSVLLTGTETTVPWEVLEKPGVMLQCGVCGTRNGDTVLPTVWVDLETILPGAVSGESAQPPTPELWEQMADALKHKADGMSYDGSVLSLLSGDETLDSIEITSDGSGTGDHRQLTNRDAQNQHPMEAITGLLDAIPRPMTADELRNILIGGTK